MNRIELVSDNDLEMRLAQCLRQGQMPDAVPLHRRSRSQELADAG